MPIFKYSARTDKGQLIKGEVEAANPSSAASLLKKKKYVIITLKEASEYKSLTFLNSFFGRVSLSDKVNFTTQLSVMISSGLHLAQALEILSLQASNAKMRKIIETLLRDVEAGKSLSRAASKYPKIFDKAYVSLVRAGEASGTLDKVLIRLAENLEKQRDLRGKIKGALIYPIIVTVAMVGVLVIIVVFVIPKLTQMYDSLNVELPLSTKILIGLSDFLITKWWLVIALVGGAFFGIRYFKNTNRGKYLFATVVLKLPIFGKLGTNKEMAEFTRTLSLLVAAGVPIVDSLQIVSEAAENVLYSDSLKKAAHLVEKGLPLSDALTRDPLFPPLISQMATVGEETGKVDEVLGKVSDYYEMEVERIVKNLSSAMEPFIMLGLGAMVGLLIISIITPIYKLTSSF